MNVVLIEPEIHWNTGNIGRTCVATGATLHLVGKLGFSLDDKAIKRSGLDYWPKLDLKVHESVEGFFANLSRDSSVLFFSTKAKASYWEAPYESDSYLVLGRESAGLPAPIHKSFRDRFYRIPISPGVRSLNLSTAAGVILYESLRQTGFDL